MANYVDLERDNYLVDDGNDGKVIIRDLADIPGGRALDMSNWTPSVVKAGHIIKHNKETGAYAPLGITGSNNDTYASLEAIIYIERYGLSVLSPYLQYSISYPTP